MTHLHHKVSALIDGELQGSARRRALDHIRSCADCRRDVEETLALKQRLLGLRASEPSADLFASLEVVAPPDPPPHPPNRSPFGVRRLLTGAGSVSLVVLSIAYVVGAPGDTPTASVAPHVDDFTAEFASNAGSEPLADLSVGALTLETTGGADPTSFALSAEVSSADTAGGGQQAGSAPTIASGDDQLAVLLLGQAAAAPSLLAYAGVRRVSTFDSGASAVADVTVRHAPGQGTVLIVEPPGGGRLDPIFVPEADQPSVDGITPSSVELLESSYDLAVLGSGTVAGRSAVVVGVGRDGELAAEMWVDADTGLLLRRDIYSEGSLVRSSAFVDVRLLDDAFFKHVPPTLPMPSLHDVPLAQASQFDDDVWTCPDSVIGTLSLTAIHRVEAGAETIHAEYSDGLSTVSIFEQRGSLDVSGLAGFAEQHLGEGVVYRRGGLPTQVVWEAEGTVFTLITDAPSTVVDQVLADLPQGVATVDSDFGSRVGSGLDKMVGFLSPVG